MTMDALTPDSQEAIDAMVEKILERAFPRKVNGRAFYQTTEFTPNFSNVPPGNPLHDRAIVALQLDQGNIDGRTVYGWCNYGDEKDFEEVEVTVIADDHSLIAGFYGHDGHVVVCNLNNDTWVENNDVKCSYRWKKIPAPKSDAQPEDNTAAVVLTRATRATHMTLTRLANSMQGMPSIDASCNTCVDGAITIIPSCPTCKRTHADNMRG